MESENKKKSKKAEAAEEKAEEAKEKEEKPEAEKKAEKQPEKAPEKTEEEKLREDLAALDDKYKRVLAEYDNFRKRSLKEKELFYGDGVASAVSYFLPVFDNLERAAAASEDEGVKKILKQAQEIFAKLNIKECGKAGDAFDPNLHNAVAHTEDESLGENVVAEVLVKGYVMGDRLIRPAMVKTAN